jgi:hypothetical protein
MLRGLDTVLRMPEHEKIRGKVRIAFQYGIPIKFGKEEEAEAFPYTFEDAIALTNPELFKKEKPTGMMKKCRMLLTSIRLNSAVKNYLALKDDKAEMALDLLYCADPAELAAPKYIQEGWTGLKKSWKWRVETLRRKCRKSLTFGRNNHGDTIHERTCGRRAFQLS